jgi:hypothetical protein
MSRMNAPWTNPEPLSDAIPEFLRSPMTIAVGASILAHGIFFLGLPVVVNSANKEDLRPVNVVQLTPQEQAQVPAIALPSATLPPSSTLTNPFPSVLTPSSPLSPTTPGLSDGSLNSPKFDIDTSQSDTSGTTYNYPWMDPLFNRSTTRSTTERAKTDEPEEKKEKEKEKEKTPPANNKTPDKENKTPDQPAENSKPSALPSVTPSIPTENKTPAPPNNQPISSPPQQPNQQPISYARADHQQLAERVENGFVYNVSDTAPTHSGIGFNPSWYRTHITENPNITDQVKKTPFQNLVIQTEKPTQLEIFNNFKQTEQIKDFNPEKPIIVAFLVDPSGKLVKDSVGIEVGSGYPAINKLATLEATSRLNLTKFPPNPNGKYELRKLGIKLVKRIIPA